MKDKPLLIGIIMASAILAATIFVSFHNIEKRDKEFLDCKRKGGEYVRLYGSSHYACLKLAPITE